MAFCLGTVYGKGVYFSTNGDYSNGYAKLSFKNERHMVIADVITGEYGQGSSDLHTPPFLPNDDIVRYDSVVDNMQKPKIYVVFRDWCSYPAYIVVYK